MSSSGEPAVVLGLDVGGSSVKYRLSSAEACGRMPDALAVGTGAPPDGEPTADLADMIRRHATGRRLAAVAIAIPGLVDAPSGTVIRSSNLPRFDGHAVGPELSSLLDVPVAVLNDGRAASIAEVRWGAGAGLRDVFTLSLGTGIAGCHVVDGDPVDGATGSGGELGHIVVAPGGDDCSCGQTGCLETLVGAPALRRAWHSAGGSGGARGLLTAYETADARAIGIVHAAADHLAAAILTLLALVDPGAVVIGGGLASAPHRLVELAAARVAAQATFHRVPPIVPARLGRWAGSIGAASEAVALAARGPSGSTVHPPDAA